MKGNRNALRKNIKHRAFELFYHIFESQPINYKHSDCLNTLGRAVVEIGRNKIGYSKKTVDCDIYYSLMGSYTEWRKLKK